MSTSRSVQDVPQTDEPSPREAYLASRPTKRQERLCFWCAKPSLMRGDQKFCSPSCRYEEFHSRKVKDTALLRSLLSLASPYCPADLQGQIAAALANLT